MKVYILVDSEGGACVVREKGADANRGYGVSWQAEYIRQRATAEASAAVRGAVSAGADEILVHDGGFVRGHTPPGLTLYYDQLPSGIRIALGMVQIKDVVDTTFDAAMLIGHHAMAGTADGVMAHTFSSVSVVGQWLNGRPIGEIAIEALVLGAFSIPVVMVSADEAGCREAADWLGPVELAPTKRGITTHGAVSLHPADACALIEAKARAGLARLRECKPLTMAPPYELRVECRTTEEARARAARKGGVLDGAHSYVIKTGNVMELI